jgi:hypothetical protein
MLHHARPCAGHFVVRHSSADITPFSVVIPEAAQRLSGIYNPCRVYGFRTCAKWRIPE